MTTVDYKKNVPVLGSYEVVVAEGLRAMEGKIVIDATGDGDVAWFAGAPVEKGRADGLMQPVTLEFTLDGVDESRAVACIGDVDDVELNGERFLDYCARCARQGLLPEQLAAVRLHRTTHPGQRQVNTTQRNGIDATCVRALYSSELELRRQIDILVHFFRENRRESAFLMWRYTRPSSSWISIIRKERARRRKGYSM